MKKQHQVFLDHYLRSRNSSAAARAAGYSDVSAHTQGCRLLKRLDIQGAIAQYDAQIQKTTTSLADRVMEELGKIGFSNIQDLYDDQGKLKPVNELPREVAAAISSVESNKGFQKVRMASKLDALATLSKILGMVKENEQAAKVQVVVLPAQSQLPTAHVSMLPVIEQDIAELNALP